MVLPRLRAKSGNPRRWWGAARELLLDPDVDEDWFGAHPGNLLAVPYDEHLVEERRKKYELKRRRRITQLQHWNTDTKKLKLIRLGKYKFTARETSLYAKQYQYDHHMYLWRYPYTEHVQDYRRHCYDNMEASRLATLRAEGRRRGEYLKYLETADPLDHLDYARWCVRGLFSL